MMTSSNGKIFHVTDHLCGEFTGHRWIPRTKARVNNGQAGDLRCHHTHYDVIVMMKAFHAYDTSTCRAKALHITFEFDSQLSCEIQINKQLNTNFIFLKICFWMISQSAMFSLSDSRPSILPI